MRPRTVLKLKGEPIGKEPAMVHEPTTSSPSGSNELNMKELAQELAPLVASAMRNYDNDHKREEKGCRSKKKKSQDERDGESEEERLSFLVSET